MLKDRLEVDFKIALKNKDAIKISTLRLLKSALQNARIAKKEELLEEDVLSIIKKQVKQRKDSIEEFKKANRQDLLNKELEELEILKAYLPEELNPEELLDMIKAAIAETKAVSIKDMGKVIKEVMARAKGRADGKAVSSLAREELSKSEKNTDEEKSKDIQSEDPQDQ